MIHIILICYKTFTDQFYMINATGVNVVDFHNVTHKILITYNV